MVKKKIQLLFVHGGMTFKNEEDYIFYLKESKSLYLEGKNSWNGTYLNENLEEFFHLIKPVFPLKENAKYIDWKILFERYLEIMDDDIILMGSSLGGIFLTKYLSENKINKNILGSYIICPPFDGDLTGEDLVGGFELGDDLSLITKNCSNTKLFFSKDDDCVPISHLDKYKEMLLDAEYFVYDNKGHFAVEEFPELIKIIKEDLIK